MCEGLPYTSAADVWALGCVLFELMSLSAPWVQQMRKAGDTRGGWTGLMRRITTEALDIDALTGRYSDGICTVLSALLTKDATHRPALRHLLEWPVLQAAEEAATVLRPRTAPEAAPGPHKHQRKGTVGTDSAAAAAAAAQLVRSWRRRSAMMRRCTETATVDVVPIAVDPAVGEGPGADVRSPNGYATPIATDVADAYAISDATDAADAGSPDEKFGIAGLNALAAAGLSALTSGPDSGKAAAALTLGRAVQRSMTRRRQRRAERRYVAGTERKPPSEHADARHAQPPPPSLASPSSSPGGAQFGLPPTPRRALGREPCRLQPEERRESATEFQGQLVDTRPRMPEAYAEPEKAASKQRPARSEKVPETPKVAIIRVRDPRRLRIDTVFTRKPVGTVPVRVQLGLAYRALSPCAIPVPYMCVLGQPKKTARAPPMSRKPYNVAPRRSVGLGRFDQGAARRD